MGRFCPSCGFNLVADEPVAIGPWFISPSEVLHEGQMLRLTPSERILLHSLATMRGRVVKQSALYERMGAESEQPHIVTVYACRVRATCRTLGIADPIETIWGSGYRWREAT